MKKVCVQRSMAQPTTTSLSNSVWTVGFTVACLMVIVRLHAHHEGARQLPSCDHMIRCIGIISSVFLVAHLIGLNQVPWLVSNSLVALLGTHLGQLFWLNTARG